MNEQTLQAIVDEIEPRVTGQKFGRVFTLGSSRFAIDLRLGGEYLFVSAEPQSPRLYLIKRKLKDLEKASRKDSPFAAILRKHLANAEITSVEKDPNDRIVTMQLAAFSELEGETEYRFVIQLTGRSSNLFLLDGAGTIVDVLKRGKGPEPGDIYEAPEAPPGRRSEGEVFDAEGSESLSEALDRHYREAEEEQKLRSAFRSAESRLTRDLKKQKRLREALEKDLETHGDEEQWKRLGDTLLANVANAKRTGEGFEVTDYFDDEAPLVTIPADPRHSVSEAAEEYFKKYAKARNAKTAIAERLKDVSKETERIERELAELRDAFEAGDRAAVFEAEDSVPVPLPGKKPGKVLRDEPTGTRKFVSRDGFEILVGKKSKDNDHLTFRIANSLDTWLHAADYPGSHVVIRNPGRKEIPVSTLVDAAKLAAFYSKAKNESKAAVRYTLRKFVHKPKGARPGLVSLADFKTIMVEPGIPELP
ncbi:MAG: NFACT family protein [Acidobacteriota bacterium]|nr:MAG: NFACT family protein [Acidobacteriota bacterium]